MHTSHPLSTRGCSRVCCALLFMLCILMLDLPTSEGIINDQGDNSEAGDNVREQISTTVIDINELDCRMRQLAMEFGKSIIESSNITNLNEYRAKEDMLNAVYDGLELSRVCGSRNISDFVDADVHSTTYSDLRSRMNDARQLRSRKGTRSFERGSTKGPTVDVDKLEKYCTHDVICIFVSALQNYPNSITVNKTLRNKGSEYNPWNSIHAALEHVQSLREAQAMDQTIMILLRHGVHYLGGKPLNLTGYNSNLVLRGYPGEKAWISGGINLKNAPFEIDDEKNGIYVANLSDLLKGHTLPATPSLFTSTRRYIRARHPNADPEIDRGGNHYFGSGKVVEWTMPPPGSPPNFTFFDFAQDPPDGVPTKTDSTMEGYNQYASGTGGACSTIWGHDADSYWCSNSSAGGWAEVDRECAVTGQMQLPMGMTYNQSDQSLAPLASSLEGGYVFAWHSQSWAMHMFEITLHSPSNGTMVFAEGGGKQGGRNWCRCDQCTYAGRWCGQHQDPPQTDDRRLISGDWMIENVRDFLDQPGEYFFDKSTSQLYVKPNSTADLHDLTLGLLTELMDMRNASGVRIENLSFRDQAATFMEEGWSAPSGGDWSLRRGGAIFVENASNISITGCHFFRLDGTAIFLSRRTRHIHIRNNIFEWLGENAIATWGETDGYDATSGAFPMYTVIEYNVMRELGIYEIQSSALGQCKAALTTVRNNVMFNMKRAAINFNDMVGGGDVVEGNLIFNTCRESGDHGPINSWDRQAYLTILKDGSTASFDPLPRIIRRNFIIANYGASQGVDNDDGSSWYHIQRNLFYQADGFKMDYGGHDSVYEFNMALSFSYGWGPCFGMGSFSEGHGDVLRGNRCLIGLDNINNNKANSDDALSRSFHRNHKPLVTFESQQPFVGRLWGSCKDSHVTLESNQYYTPDGIALIGCDGDTFFELSDLQAKFGLESNSTVERLPDVNKILDWARSTLLMVKATTLPSSSDTISGYSGSLWGVQSIMSKNDKV